MSSKSLESKGVLIVPGILFLEVTDDTERSMPLKEEFISYIFQEKETCHSMQGHMGSTRVGQKAEGTRGKLGQERNGREG